MPETVSYICTGYMLPNLILVNFTMGNQSENLTYAYDGTRPIKEFLEEKAIFVAINLKRKLEVMRSTKVDLLSCVGVKGVVEAPIVPIPFRGNAVPSIFIPDSHVPKPMSIPDPNDKPSF